MTLLDDIKASRKRRGQSEEKVQPKTAESVFDIEDLKAAQRRRLEATPEGRAQLAEINRPRQFVQPPEARTGAGPFFSGVERGLTDVGLGAFQIGTGVAERAGIDVGQLPGRTREAVTTTRERFEAETKGAPVRGFVGQVAGLGAAVPLAAQTATGAAAVGALTGALLPTEGESGVGQRVINTITGAVGGAAFQKALPFISRNVAAGGRKSIALLRGVAKAVGGGRGDEFISADGVITQAGKDALEAAGVNVGELAEAAAQADSISANDLQAALFRGIRGAGEEQLDPVSATRLARAEQLDIPLTSGQAQQNFALQSEEDLLRNLTTEQGAQARLAADQAQVKIKGAVNKFVGQFGEEFQTLPKDQQGAAIKAGIKAVKDRSRQEVTDLYLTAQRTAGGDIPVEAGDLADDIIFDIIERGAEPGTERAMLNALAKFGLIGEEVGEKGVNTLVDFNEQIIPVRGNITPLTLSNAETFRKLMNKVFPADKTGVVGGAISGLDDAVEDTLEKAAGAGAEQVQAFQTARGAFRTFKEVFSAKDIVEELVAFKKGTGTPRLDESIVVQKIFRARNARENVIRVKKALLATTPDPKARAAGRAAWREFQQAGIDDLFGQAISPQGKISGARLNTAVKKIGNPTLRELMTKDQFVAFKQLQAAIGDATIPIEGTINPSGSGNRVVNAVLNMAEKFPLPSSKVGAGVIRRQIDKTTREESSKKALSQIQAGRAARLRGDPTAEQLAAEKTLASFIGRYTARQATRSTLIGVQEGQQ